MNKTSNLGARFAGWWAKLTPTERDCFTPYIADACGVSFATVRSWGLGYRSPRERVHRELINCLKKKKITI